MTNEKSQVVGDASNIAKSWGFTLKDKCKNQIIFCTECSD